MIFQGQFRSPERGYTQPRRKPSLRNIQSAIPRYGLAGVSVALALLAALFLQHYKFRGVALSLFLFAVVLTVWYAGVGPAMLATVLSILCFIYFFSPPIYSFAFSVADVPAIVILLSFAVLIIRFSAVRKRTERALRRSEGYLAEAQRLSYTGSWAWSPITREAVYWSEEMFRVFGFDPQQAPPTSEAFWERVHPEDRDSMLELMRKAAREKTEYEHDHRIVLPDGTVKYIHAIGHPAPNRAGNVVEFVGTAVDVTERKRAEQERDRQLQLEADLARINRVSMMGELAASLAHEIKQPIAAAATNAETCLRWLQRQPPEIEKARETAVRIAKDVNRAAAIIDRNRSLYRQGAPQWEPVDVNEVIRGMIVLLRDAAQRHSISIRTELDAGLGPIPADRVQLQQVLMNLMLNGIEAMKDTSGELTIRSKKTEDGQTLLSVSDLGIGLPVENAERIFDAFFTSKAQGTGMGLAISRRIVECHGGHLWATANSDRGTTFHFTLSNEATRSSTSGG